MLSLPNEILTTVCADDDLSANDLAAIRLTCKELHATATKEFAQRYFKDPFVMMSRKSLEALVDICKHPVFGPYVRKIQLLNNHFNQDTLRWFAQRVADAYETKNVARRASEKRQLQIFMDLLAEQYDLFESGVDVELLGEVFKVLGAQGRPVAVASQRFLSSCPPIGWSKAVRGLNEDPIGIILGNPKVLSTIKVLLEAAKVGACPISKLEVGVNCFRDHREERFPRHGLKGPLMSGLQEVRYDFEWRDYHELHNSLAYRQFASLLESVPSDLETLFVCSNARLTTPNAHTYTIMPSLAHGLSHSAVVGMQCKALKKIHLSKMFLHQYNMLRFLDVHEASLKELTFDEIFLEGEWDQVLAHIAGAFSLEHFDLRKAHEVVPDRRRSVPVVIKPRYSRDCELRSKNEMRQSLDMFIELQKAERRAEEAASRERAMRRLTNRRTGPLRRSSRIESQKPADIQK